ncbi:hypothetical protein PROFUN_02175 [Planoprotostelium fungivorum]|uniref:Uncharacterized protein n=1 Tax=Planoprotostelium fungivorum TaxID=1890364 RepID=A0A2P6NZB9_9EUKA|nr:hypothetical protein PROFUN_02175 [Planoprotostelium fungivorum]
MRDLSFEELQGDWLSEVIPSVGADAPTISMDTIQGHCHYCHHHISLVLPIEETIPKKRRRESAQKWVWTEDLHAIFLSAFDECTRKEPHKRPSATLIMTEMVRLGAPSHIKRTVVASHCQKFDKKLRERVLPVALSRPNWVTSTSGLSFHRREMKSK